MIHVAPEAVEAIRQQIAKRNVPDTSLRFGVRGGGCSGFSYVIEFHDGPASSKDELFEFKASDGSIVRVLVDLKSLAYLDGSTIQWESTLIKQGFRVANPNEKSSCGCGVSFTF